MEPCITAGTGIEETGFGYTMSLVSGKYKMIILYWLAEYSVLRYNELKRRLGTISHKTLSLSLKELEADGLVQREEYPQIPPKVEYSLSERGRSLIPILDAMCIWGEENRPRREGSVRQMDVIAAIATGSAATAIGIVRVSGDGCFALCGRVFRAAGGRPFAAQEPRKMVFGEMLDRAGRVIDRGLAVRVPGAGQLHRGGLRRVPLPRLPRGAAGAAVCPLRRRGPAGPGGGVHQAGVFERPDGPDPGGGGGGPDRRGDRRRGPERRRPAGRRPAPGAGAGPRRSCWTSPPGFTRWWTTRTRTFRMCGRRRSPLPSGPPLGGWSGCWTPAAGDRY